MLAPTLTLESESESQDAEGDASSAKSESLSPPRFQGGKIIDSPIGLRQKLDYLLKHSVNAPLLGLFFELFSKDLYCQFFP